MLNYFVGHAEDPTHTELLYAALKAFKYLFRFIVQSRVLYLRWVLVLFALKNSLHKGLIELVLDLSMLMKKQTAKKRRKKKVSSLLYL